MTPTQFDFRTNWPDIRRHLANPIVALWTTFGMKLENPGWTPEDGPFSVGRGPINGRPDPQPDTVEWYQPIGRCHSIAPFAWAVGRLLLPHLRWGFYTSDWHTVAVGCTPGTATPEVVMDILLFETFTAGQSLRWVDSHPGDKDRNSTLTAWNPIKMYFPQREAAEIIDAIPEYARGEGFEV